MYKFNFKKLILKLKYNIFKKFKLFLFKKLKQYCNFTIILKKHT